MNTLKSLVKTSDLLSSYAYRSTNSVLRKGLLGNIQKMSFYFQHHTHGAGDVRFITKFFTEFFNCFIVFYLLSSLIQPHIVAKRVISCVGNRLREYDPHRWNGVPITYKTVFNGVEANTVTDIACSIHIHDALEREFNIDIDDKKVLLRTVEDCVKHIMEDHKSI